MGAAQLTALSLFAAGLYLTAQTAAGSPALRDDVPAAANVPARRNRNTRITHASALQQARQRRDGTACADGVLFNFEPPLSDTKGRYLNKTGLVSQLSRDDAPSLEACAFSCIAANGCRGFAFSPSETANIPCVLYNSKGSSGTLLAGRTGFSYYLLRDSCRVPVCSPKPVRDPALRVFLASEGWCG